MPTTTVAIGRLTFTSGHFEETPLYVLNAMCAEVEESTCALCEYPYASVLESEKIMAVKKLLRSGVTLFELAAALRLLSSDDRITTTGRLLESRSIEKADAASY